MTTTRSPSRRYAAVLATALAATALAATAVRGGGEPRRPATRPLIPPFDLNAPVALYARAVDQDGRPLAGVRVDLCVGVANPGATGMGGRYDAHNVPMTRTTDADGRFAVEGERGYMVQLMGVRKDGYLLSPAAPTGFGYLPGNAKPCDPGRDPRHPAVYRMWRRRGDPDRRPPAYVDKGYRVPYDGTPVTIDLVTGKPVPAGRPGGDLRVRMLSREWWVDPHEGRWAHRWTATIEAAGDGGGLAVPRPDDEFMFEAPADGYRPAVPFGNEPGRSAPLPSALFVRGRGGALHGSLMLEFSANPNDPNDADAHIYIESHLTTDGSRNLEFDYWQSFLPANPDWLTLRYGGWPKPPDPEVAAAATRPARPPLDPDDLFIGPRRAGP